jgi:hypothetical protein
VLDHLEGCGHITRSSDGWTLARDNGVPVPPLEDGNRERPSTTLSPSNGAPS